MPDESAVPAAPVPADGTVVVVGGGLAAHSAAVALRARGHLGPVVVLSAEDLPPYDRPPLSKAVLSQAALLTAGPGDDEPPDTALPPLPDDVELRTGVRATGLGPGVVRTDAGDVAFDGLVIATGAEPLRLPGPGEQLTLRTRADALALRGRLRAGDRLVVVGAGWIGAEVATAALAAGMEVTVVEAGPAPFATPLGADLGAATTAWFSDAGVRLLLDTPVAEVVDGGVRLADGSLLAADTVLVGVGARPVTGWLDGGGVRLHRSGGVVTDEHLRTSLAGVVAVGDVAAWWSRRAGTHLLVEHWDDALQAPTVAAATLLAPAEGLVHDPVPYFWSEHLGRRVQVAGFGVSTGELVVRGEPATGTGAWFRLDGDVLRAVVTVDQPRVLLQARRAVGERVDRQRLADPAVAVRDAVITG